MKLELKHLAPYLPHRLECKDLADETNFTLDVLNVDGVLNDATYLNTIRLYLRPLSDLTKEIEVNVEKFVPLDILTDLSGYDCLEFDLNNVFNQPYTQIQKLLEWHFDVFGLIEQGLAININEL